MRLAASFFVAVNGIRQFVAPRRGVRRRVFPLVLSTFALGQIDSALASDTTATMPSAAEVQRRWTSRLDGRHFTARVRLIHEVGGRTEERLLTVWRDDSPPGHERLMARFEQPPDMRGLGLLYLENPDRPSDYFLYQPAARRVRRIPEALAQEDVYGMDLEFLGFGVARREPMVAEALEQTKVGDRPAVRLVERTTGPSPRFDRREVVLDSDTYVPLEAREYRGSKLVLSGKSDGIRVVNGIPTPMRVQFEHGAMDERVTLVVEAIDYESAIPDTYFSTLALIKER
jgi:hypothetical protein